MDLSPTALMGSLNSDLEQHFGGDSLNCAGPLSFLPNCDPSVVAAETLRGTLLKKFRGGTKDRKAADRAAFDLFLKWNARCEAWSEPIVENEVDAELVGEFRSCFLKCFELPYGQVIDFSSDAPANFRVGPGAAVGAKLTDLYTKLYAGELTTTSEELYWHYFDSTLPFQLENEAEIIRSLNFPTTVVSGCNLGFAAKNSEISRTRTTQPNLNMIYQLGTGRRLEEVIRQRYGISLSTQPDCNRELSRIGSLTKKVSTTDLTSASDATSVNFWHWAMPYQEIHDWFMWIRTDRTKHPFPVKQGQDEWIDLHVLSSMGNGFTFPLMTLIFLCVVEAVYNHLGIKLVKNRVVRRSHLPDDERTVPGNFGVFGDDIIVDSRAYQLVNHLLEMLGYAVNREKSFGPEESGADGSFRESCGTDWFLGHNVRGVYCKTLDRPQDRYTLINRLNAWSAEWDIPLPKTIGFLLKTVWYLPVPPWESADAGVIVPFCLFRATKFDEYGGYIYSGMRPIALHWDPSKGLTGRHIAKNGTLDHSYYREVTEEDCDEDLAKGRKIGDIVRERYSPFINLDGLLLTAVKGVYRSGVGIGVRSDESGPRFKKTSLSTPGWAYTSWSSVGFTPTGWARFEKTLACANLGKTRVTPLVA